MTLGAVISALASAALVADSIILGSHPRAVTLGCDIGARLSCSTVAASPWSNLVPLWGAMMPNAMIGMLAFPVFIGFGVSLMAGFRPRRVLRVLMATGMALALCGALFLLAVSVTVIGVLCPWCLTMDAGVLLLVIGGVRWMRTTGGGRMTLTASWASLPIEAVPFALLAVAAVTAAG